MGRGARADRAATRTAAGAGMALRSSLVPWITAIETPKVRGTSYIRRMAVIEGRDEADRSRGSR